MRHSLARQGKEGNRHGRRKKFLPSVAALARVHPMSKPTSETEKQASRYTITTEHNPGSQYAPAGSVTATMRCKGRKTTWTETRPTKDEAVSFVLRHLRDDLRPHVAVDPAPPAPKAPAYVAPWAAIDGVIGPIYFDGYGVPRHGR